MIDAKYLAEIKTREKAATPGPWNEEGWALPNEDGEYIELTDDSPSDAAFIAHSRADIPALIAEVERLTKELSEIKENQLDPLEMVKVAIALEENHTLKKALYMMYADNKEYNPDGMGNPAYYISQAEDQEESHE